MKTRLTSKGQITNPKAVRDHLGIAAGVAIAFELVPDGSVVLTKVDDTGRTSRFGTLRGRAGSGLTTDQIMAPTRGGG